MNAASFGRAPPTGTLLRLSLPNGAEIAGEQSDTRQTREPRNERSEMPGRSVGSRGMFGEDNVPATRWPEDWGSPLVNLPHPHIWGVKAVCEGMASMSMGRFPGLIQGLDVRRIKNGMRTLATTPIQLSRG